MAIHTDKVVSGGIAAGIVLNVCDFVSSYITAAQSKAELDALSPSLMAKMAGSSNTFVLLDFIFGLILVWTYAAIRPRFGPGVRTALTAGVLVWAVSSLTWFWFVTMGLFSLALFIKSACIALVTMLLGAYVGGMIYKEA